MADLVTRSAPTTARDHALSAGASEDDARRHRLHEQLPAPRGSVFGFEGSEKEAAELGCCAAGHDPWPHLAQTDLVLTPAACYPVYPAVAKRGPLPSGGVCVDAGAGLVFRNEPSGDPARLQMFHQRELVRIGEPETVVGVARQVARPRDRHPHLDRPRCPLRRRLRPLLRPDRPPARQVAARAGAEVRGAGSDRLARADRDRELQLSSRTFHQPPSHHDGRRRRGTYCLPRLRAGTLHRRASAQARARSAHGLATCARCSGDERRDADPTAMSAHPLHAPDRAYRETNCYTDVLIELLHSRGFEPLAALGHLVRTDFEGDQFTFFKMPPCDVERLYGVDIHEMQPVARCPTRSASTRARADDAGRARLLLPARHRGDGLPAQSREDRRLRSKRSIRRPSRSATSTIPGSMSCRGRIIAASSV